MISPDHGLYAPLESAAGRDESTVATRRRTAAGPLRLIGLDSHHGDVIWSLEPALPAGELAVWAKLLPSHMHLSTLSLVVSSSAGHLHVWDIDSATGHAPTTAASSHQQCSSSSGSEEKTCRSSSSSSSRKGSLVYRLSPPVRTYLNVHAVNIHSLPTRAFTYVLQTSIATGDLKALSMSILPLYTESSLYSNSSVDALLTGTFSHTISTADGDLVSYQIDTSSCSNHTVSGLRDSKDSSPLTTCRADSVASVVFNPHSERIVSVTYPRKAEKISQRYT